MPLDRTTKHEKITRQEKRDAPHVLWSVTGALLPSLITQIHVLNVSENIMWPKNKDVDELFFFIRTDLEKCSITSLGHQCIIICSEWVPSEWESKQLIKHHNNIQVIHTTPVHQLTSCETKSCMFVRNKSIIKMSLLVKIRAHNNASPLQ